MKLVLEATELSIGYASRKVKLGLNFSFNTGQLVCLMGPNGAGKSTLLRTIAGLQPALCGDISVLGKPLVSLNRQERARLISLVLTDMPLGSLSVQELVALGRQPHTNWFGSQTEKDKQKVNEAINTVGLAMLSERTLTTLSDGQRQKALIARALAQEGTLLLLDEPTAHLDLLNRIQIMQLLRTLAHEQQKTIIVATHELHLALQTADVLWLLPEGENTPSTQGLPEDLLLNGSIEKVFKKPGFYFDAESANFNLEIKPRGKVWVEGQGTKVYWLKRALERYGYVMDKDAGLLIVEKEGRWKVNDLEIKNLSIAEVIGIVSGYD